MDTMLKKNIIIIVIVVVVIIISIFQLNQDLSECGNVSESLWLCTIPLSILCPHCK